MKIRKARKEDMKAVQDLRYNLSKYEKDIGLNIAVPEWGYTEVGERDYNYFLNKQFIFVAEENEKIVGFITGEILSKKEWYTVQLGTINNLYVLEEYRHKGIGKQLMQTMMNSFKEKGIETFELYAFSNNVDALKFYEKLGFKKYNVQMLYQKNN